MSPHWYSSLMLPKHHPLAMICGNHSIPVPWIWQMWDKTKGEENRRCNPKMVTQIPGPCCTQNLLPHIQSNTYQGVLKESDVNNEGPKSVQLTLIKKEYWGGHALMNAFKSEWKRSGRKGHKCKAQKTFIASMLTWKGKGPFLQGMWAASRR